MEKICCRCRRNEREGQWVPVKDENEKKFSYGYCPNCYQETMAEIQMAFEYRLAQTSDLRI
ncbi:MAG: hypothetical protein V1706_04780 [Pseudomonadota bacterium]